MAAYTVIPNLYILEEVILPWVYPLLLQRGKETLHRSIILAIAFAAHTTADLLRFDQLLIAVADI